MTEMKTATLAEFLLARVAEDVAAALRALDQPMGYRWRTVSWLTEANRDHGLRHDPTRVAMECDSVRQIVERASEAQRVAMRDYEMSPFPLDMGAVANRAAFDALDAVVRALALPYSDHPDYRDEWRP